jgi:hypothetical protein
MENEILKGILDELKGLRKDTNEKLNQTNERLDQTNIRLDGLTASVVVLQQGVNEVRYELQGVKQVLADRVIWQNDNITLQTREGNIIYGVIRRASKE